MKYFLENVRISRVPFVFVVHQLRWCYCLEFQWMQIPMDMNHSARAFWIDYCHSNCFCCHHLRRYHNLVGQKIPWLNLPTQTGRAVQRLEFDGLANYCCWFPQKQFAYSLDLARWLASAGVHHRTNRWLRFLTLWPWFNKILILFKGLI